jgi:PAS domain S-box-containing protein
VVRPASLLRKTRLLASLALLICAGAAIATARAVRNFLARPFRMAPFIRADTALLMSTYEVMRQRLRESLREIEQKNIDLEESRERLRRSRDFLQTTIDSIDDELMVLDSQLRITQANRRLRLRYKDQEIMGRYCYEVSHGFDHPCRPPNYTCPLNEVKQTGTSVRVVHVLNIDHDGGGAEKYIEVSASPIYDGNGKISQIVELTRDITESTEAEKRILEANRQLVALNAIASTVSESLSLGVILNSALDKTLELINCDVGGILLLDEKSQTLSYGVHRGLSKRFVQGIAGLAPGEGIAGKAAQMGETLVVNDISKDHRVTRPVVAEENLKAFVSQPLMSKGRVVGVLNVASRKPRSFSQQEIQLLSALGHQLGTAIENARLYQELQSKEQMRAELLRKIISAQEDERRRVARELHDVTSQALATLAVRLEALAAVPGSSVKERERKIEETRALLATTSDEVRRLIYALRPTVLDDLGLPAALRSCAANSLGAAGIEVHVEMVGEERRLQPQVEIAIFRIAQEAMTNVVRHARADSTYISLEFKEKSVALQIEDDGIGFDLSEESSSTDVSRRGAGLLGMKERTELLGGTLRIITRPGCGTRVEVEIQVDWEEHDHV